MEAIQALRQQGFDLWLEGQDIHCLVRQGARPDKEKVHKLLAELKAHKPAAVEFFKQQQDSGLLQVHCQGCPCHEIGPDPFGKNIIHWCGPFKEPDTTRWLNIAELTACPKGNWADVSKTVH
jgi:selenocysteine lyase/cysteine desulfurase